jgi:acetyl-CoA synthetase
VAAELKASWEPDPRTVARANLTTVIRGGGFASYEELHRWSTEDRSAFWQMVLDRLGIVFDTPPDEVLAGSERRPIWLRGARMNIVNSCFTASPEDTAIVFRRDGAEGRLSYGKLRKLVDRCALGLTACGVGAGDRVAIAMPMTVESVVAYLGVVSVGAVVVSIADSFAPHEIATRLTMTQASLVITQDRLLRGGRALPMFEKVVGAGATRCIVVETGAGIPLRPSDLAWERFLAEDGAFEPVPCLPNGHVNILFSSGTTGTPKAIPWTHLTAIKSAMDGHFHHDIHPDDVVAWPTNLGWMLGPWLIFASLANRAAMGLYDDAPTERGFVDFVRDAGITVLGFVPSLVSAWRASGALEGAGWTRLRVLSSSGEVSLPDDCRWMMDATGAPIIEYCGGTEIGGGYLSGTVLQPAVAATFTTPVLGLDVRILDEAGRPADNGETFLVPPSMGLSQELLESDHDEVYFAGVPDSDVVLRRHGDRMERLGDGYYRALGRVDDTMNLGGIKVSSAELERVVGGVEGVAEAAAVGVPPAGGGPSRLVVYAVAAPEFDPDPDAWKAEMQAAIRAELNPLFRIDELIVGDVLPRTASEKVNRRELRARHE